MFVEQPQALPGCVNKSKILTLRGYSANELDNRVIRMWFEVILEPNHSLPYTPYLLPHRVQRLNCKLDVRRHQLSNKTIELKHTKVMLN